MVPLMSEEEFAKYQYRMVLQAGGELVDGSGNGEEGGGKGEGEVSMIDREILSVLPFDSIPSQRLQDHFHKKNEKNENELSDEIEVDNDIKDVGVEKHHHQHQPHHKDEDNLMDQFDGKIQHVSSVDV